MAIDLHTLSGAYAIDALSAEEAAQFTTHLEQCQACRDEVRELQDAAATMGASEAVVPPSALRARVLEAADRQPQLPPRTTAVQLARSRRWLPRAAAAAAAVVVVTGGAVLYQGTRDTQGPTATPPPSASQAPTSSESPVQQVFNAPDAHTATVTTANGGRLRVATSAAFGQMAVSTKGLPRLEHRTYQLWALRNGHATSVGLLDRRAGKVMPLPTSGTEVAITVEPLGGSKQPTRPAIITMDPEQV